MNRTTKLVGASLATLLLAACNSSSSPTQLDPNPPSPPPPPPPVGEFELRVHHASADAPAVNITVNGGNFLENVDYQVSSGPRSC